MMIKYFRFLVIVCMVSQARAQTDSSASAFTFSGYVETYYTFDFNKPSGHNRPPFVYSFNRHNEFSLNLGLLRAAYQKNNLRVNLAMATGTYMKQNLAAEPDVFKNVYEANVGIRLSNKKQVWLDAGIFSSHIGFESAIGKDCWNLTRSILADNSPYYESGVKISYTSDDNHWFFSGLLLNGWQRIQRVDGNSALCFGHQLTYTPNSRVTLNSSSFIGTDQPDSSRRMRYFHNAYGIIKFNEHWAITAGFDIGAEQKEKKSRRYNFWYAPVIIVKNAINKKNILSARVEYYQDPQGVIIPAPSANGFRTWGYSANYDHYIRENILYRIEARCFQSPDRIFQKGAGWASDNIFLSTSLAVSL